MSIELELESYCAEHGTFTQSALWAKVKESWNAEYIISKDNHGKLRGSMLVLIKRLPFGKTFLYAPRGPICDMNDTAALSDLLSQAVCLVANYQAFMLKIDPMILSDDKRSIDKLQALGFTYHADRVGYDNIQCRENYILDLQNKSEDEVFNSFKSKWRYNIRLASKRGVDCVFCREEKLDDFMLLMKQTAKRDGFEYRQRSYFKRILQVYGERAMLCICYLDNKPLSGALCIKYAGVMSYVYGCTSSEHRNCMPNYLMQWTMIQKAVQDGCHTYDFCGIPYWYDEKHPNYGVYRFKQGFNGKVITYAGEFDYCCQPMTCLLFDTAQAIQRKSGIFGRFLYH